MKLSLFIAAFSVNLLIGVSNAAKLTKTQNIDFSFIDKIHNLELTQSEAENMSQSEVDARAETIADLFLNSAVDGEVSAEARAEVINKIGTWITKGVQSLADVALPALAIVIGLRLLEPFFNALQNNGVVKQPPQVTCKAACQFPHMCSQGNQGPFCHAPTTVGFPLNSTPNSAANTGSHAQL